MKDLFVNCCIVAADGRLDSDMANSVHGSVTLTKYPKKEKRLLFLCAKRVALSEAWWCGAPQT